MNTEATRQWLRGGLTGAEWQELVALEYVLTWNYSDNTERDEARMLSLRDKCWAGRGNISPQLAENQIL